MRFTKNINSFALGLIFAASLMLAVSAVVSAGTCESGDAAACLNQSDSTKQVLNIIVIVLNFLAAAVGVAAVIMIVVAGIQYSAAADNPQAVQAAKQKIYNVLIGLLAFFFLYGFLQWLIPGGVLVR